MCSTSSSQPRESESDAATSSPILTTIHPDIIHAHILSRLDGAALAAASSVSSGLRRLCTADHLWREICTATWPSLSDTDASRVISTFPSGYRSVFSDAFPSLRHHNLIASCPRRPSTPPPEELISAVDIHYNGKPVFSRVQRTETRKNGFQTTPFWIEMLEPEETIPTPVRFTRKNEELLKHLEERLSLSWILIDPSRKRAANLSSRWPVTVRRHWLTRELEVVYAVAMMGEGVRCAVRVTCDGKAGGELHVKEVSLGMEDEDGRRVNGTRGVEVVRRAMESGERGSVGAREAKEWCERFELVVRERREKRHQREKVKDIVTTLVAFFAFIFFCWIAGL